jgi:hypothetical protein
MPRPNLHLDHIKDDRQLSAADVLVVSSIQDNLPNTALESLACGTPIIGFAVSGLPDIVRHGVNGLLLLGGDMVALGKAITELLLAPEKVQEMSTHCRRLARILTRNTGAPLPGTLQTTRPHLTTPYPMRWSTIYPISRLRGCTNILRVKAVRLVVVNCQDQTAR